jgi:hypothetical protein
METVKPYDEQMQEIFTIAEEHFGSDYFERLDKLVEEINEDEELPKYSLTVNYKGAFYACEE